MYLQETISSGVYIGVMVGVTNSALASMIGSNTEQILLTVC